MSGRKVSPYQVEQSIREALQCGLEAENLAAEADAQVHGLSEQADKVPAVRASVRAVQAVVDRIRRRLSEVAGELKAKRWFRLPLDRVQGFRNEILALRTTLQTGIQQCCASQAMAAGRMALDSLRSEIQARESDSRIWDPVAFDALRSKVDRQVGEADRALSTGSNGEGGSDLATLSSEWGAICARAMAKRMQAKEREFVLEALTKACQDLGFAVQETRTEDPAGDLIAEVNTYSHGTIRFRLELDGAIHSESPMVPDSCDLRFGQIVENLRKVGVTTAFRYEADGKPLFQKRGAKSLPESGSGKALGAELP